MKYLKIFEAFGSERINKTLNFLNKDSKAVFIRDLKEICLKLDIPYSDINDDYIEYLPYKSAISKFVSLDDESCDATSIKAFSQNGVEGESCKAGKQKRKWGKSVREVDCPICKGTGVKQRNNTLKLIKYWFDKDGKYISKSGVSGLNKEFTTSEIVTDGSWSQDLDDYEIVKSVPLTNAGLSSVETGSIISVTRAGSNDTAIGVYIKNGYYLLSNNSIFSYSRPSNSATLHKKYGTKYSYYLGSARTVNLLKPIKSTDTSNFNFAMTSGINLSPNLISKGLLSNAHFALILDVDKLKDLKHKSLKDILNKRKDSKKDALAFVKNDDVKKMNIDRYISKLSEMPSDVSKCKNVVLRILGGDMIFLLIRRGYFSNLDHVMAYYTTLLSCIDKDGNVTDQGKFDTYTIELKNMIKSYNNYIKSDKLNVKNSIDKFEKEETDELSLQILKKLKSISKLLFEKVKETNIENIDDLEVLLHKLYTLRNVVSGSRSPIYSIYNGAINHIASNYNSFKRTLIDRQYNGGEQSLQYFDRLENIINKMF